MKRRTSPTIRRILAAAAASALLLAAWPAFAEDGPEPKEAPKKSRSSSKKERPFFTEWSYSGGFAFELIYDDNIIHYSGDDLLEFETVLNTGKYSIDQAGDWILRPRFELEAASRGFGGEKVSANVRLTSWRYVDSEIKNNESYDVTLKHGAWGISNFQLGFYHAPMSYIRNFRDRAPYVSRAAPLKYTDFSYTSTSLDLAFWKRYTKKTSGKVEVKRSWRYFNQAFMENDNWEWRFTGYVQYALLDFLDVKGEYSYSAVEGRGADSVGETRENSDDSDPSYDRDSFGFDLLFALPKKTPLRLTDFDVKTEYQVYYFTSRKTLYEDAFHVGRKDKIYRIETSWATGEYFDAVSFEGGYRYTKRTSTAPEASAGQDIGEEKDYTDNRFWFGVEYPF